MSKNRVRISTQAVCIDDENVSWIFSNEYNALFKKKLPNGKAEYVGCFEEEEKMQGSLYTAAFFYAGKIAFIPCNAKKIAIYDIVKSRVSYLKFDRDKNAAYFNSICLDKRRILLFPVQYSTKAHILNMETLNIETFVLEFYNREIYANREIKGCFCGNGYADGMIYMAVRGSAYYVTYDYSLNQITQHEFGKTLWYIGGYGNDIIAITEKEGVYHLKDEKCLANEAHIKKDICNFDIALTHNAIQNVGEKLLILPIYGNEVIEIKNSQMNKFLLDENYYKIRGETPQPFAMISCDERKNTYLWPYHGDKIIILSKNNEVQYESLEIEVEELIEVLKDNLDSERTLTFSESLLGLETYIELICNF